MRSRRSAPGVLLTIVLLACPFLIAAPRALASSGQDRVSFGSRVVVGESEAVDDVVCFFCSVEAHGKISGDVVTFFGNVKSSDKIAGDVVSFGGDVLLNDSADVQGDTVIFGGSLHRSDDARLGGNQVVLPTIIFAIPLFVVFGIVWAISALFRRRMPRFYVPPAR